MKHANFLVKLTSFALMLGALAYYQTIAGQRAAAMAEREAQIAEVEAYNDQIRRENEALERALDAEPEEKTGPYADGVYAGEGTGYGGPITVSVTVEGGYIAEIEVIDHSGEDPAYYMLAEGLVSEMVKAQSTEVDAATGATFSSAGLMQAVSAALEQAVTFS